jgi:hypothetical protein
LALQFANAASNGFLVAVEQSREVNQATAAQFDGLSAGIKSTFSFTQGLEEATHRLFGRRDKPSSHDGILPTVSLFRPARLPKKQRAKKTKQGS